MSIISKLCDDLRKAADEEGYCPNRYIELMQNAADTIEALSAKVREQNFSCTYCEHYDQQQTATICKDCRRYYIDKHSLYEPYKKE